MIYQEKDGSFTINCKEGGTVSTRNFGMVGKAYRTASEAFKDADYAEAIQRPQKAEYDHIWAILVVLIGLGFIVAIFSRF